MDTKKIEEFKYFADESKGHHLQLSDLFRLSLRVFRVRKTRTFLTILGISLGIGTVLFLVSLGYGLQYILIGKLASTEDSLISLETFYPGESNLNISYEDIENIISLEESAEISPIGEFTSEGKTDSLSGFLLARVVKPNYFRLSGTKPDIGLAFKEGEKAIVISSTALKLFGFNEEETTLGKEMFFSVFYEGEEDFSTNIVKISEPLIIKGIMVDEFQPPFVLIPEEILEQDPPFFTRLFVKAKDIDSVEILRDKLIEKGFLISARIDLVNQAKKIMTIMTVILAVFGVAALVVASIGMFNTMIIGFLERIFEVGIMKSIGATVQDIRNLFLMESLIMGLLGGAGGIFLGVFAGESFNLGLNILSKQLGGNPIDLFIYPVKFLVFIIVLSGAVGILSGFWPARRAAGLSPKQAFLRK